MSEVFWQNSSGDKISWSEDENNIRWFSNLVLDEQVPFEKEVRDWLSFVVEDPPVIWGDAVSYPIKEPLIVLHNIYEDRAYNYDGPNNLLFRRVQIDCFHNSYYNSSVARSKVIRALHLLISPSIRGVFLYALQDTQRYDRGNSASDITFNSRVDFRFAFKQ